MADAGHTQDHHHDPFHPAHLFGHVQDSDHIELPRSLAPPDGHFALPQPFKTSTPLIPGTGFTEPLEFKFTKFMLVETMTAVLMILIFAWVGGRIRHGRPPHGRLWNLLESMLVFVRDNIARPAIGHHDADRFLPFLWTLFFFILGCNLMGLIPWLGSPTAALATTGALAILTFGVVLAAGMAKLGFVGFWKSLAPHMDLPFALKLVLLPLIYVIEFFGLLIKHGVLAIRLLANMLGGHLVLAVLLAFIPAVAGSAAFYAVMPSSVLGAVALSMLELLVAFIQAYVFTMLSALFIGTAVHPH